MTTNQQRYRQTDGGRTVGQLTTAVTRFAPGYPGGTQYPFGYFLHCEISESSVSMYCLRLFKATHFHVLRLLTPEFARIAFYRRASKLQFA